MPESTETEDLIQSLKELGIVKIEFMTLRNEIFCLFENGNGVTDRILSEKDNIENGLDLCLARLVIKAKQMKDASDFKQKLLDNINGLGYR